MFKHSAWNILGQILQWITALPEHFLKHSEHFRLVSFFAFFFLSGCWTVPGASDLFSYIYACDSSAEGGFSVGRCSDDYSYIIWTDGFMWACPTPLWLIF